MHHLTHSDLKNFEILKWKWKSVWVNSMSNQVQLEGKMTERNIDCQRKTKEGLDKIYRIYHFKININKKLVFTLVRVYFSVPDGLITSRYYHEIVLNWYCTIILHTVHICHTNSWYKICFYEATKTILKSAFSNSHLTPLVSLLHKGNILDLNHLHICLALLLSMQKLVSLLLSN